MIPAAFEYARASSVEEAVKLLDKYGDEAKVLAGGHSLIPLMRLRLSPARWATTRSATWARWAA